MRLIEMLKRRWRYRNTWGTKIGRDCISLDCSLADWLGERLKFLAANSHGYPFDKTEEMWAAELNANGDALLAYSSHYNAHTAEEEERIIQDGSRALHWVADNLGTLWD